MLLNKNIFLFLLICSFSSLAALRAQDEGAKQKKNDSLLSIYRSSAELKNDLVHTKLEIKPDFAKRYVYGKAWITLNPHFYPTNTLVLDAKNMLIDSVMLIEKNARLPLAYAYDDGLSLHINLPRSYAAEEKYMVYIKYTARPDEKMEGGSAAIKSDKGFYFINPDGAIPHKPTEFWTQGETESNSVWFPTIDKPNQKSTEEISVTVPQKFVTLSNGLLQWQKSEGDLRTDHWAMDKPHAPYLFFVAGGEYAVVKDTPYKGKEVSYYVYKEYEPFAKRIFGETPAMIRFFSDALGVDYPWDKYAQIVGTDFVSGAMENTTSVLHKTRVLQNDRQLSDGNTWEDVIAHELFHHWFGDLVTAESWSNITLNESFADYSEYLWFEHRYGKNKSEAKRFETLLPYYLNGKNHQKNLVRFHYRDKEEMFDAVSYNKGGAILHMLRNYLGDQAFFASLRDYLTVHKFQSAEAHDLRLSFEKISGKDLNWFFNQWYFGSGHPKIDISYEQMPEAKKTQVTIAQTGKVFILPCAVDVHYKNARVVRKQYMLSKKDEKILVDYDSLGAPPLWISVDADKIWIAEKNDNQSTAAYLYQWTHGNFIDKKEALLYFQQGLFTYDSVRKAVMEEFSRSAPEIQQSILEIIQKNIDKLTKKEWKAIEKAALQSDPFVQAQAIACLGRAKDRKRYKKLFINHLFDSSYAVAGESLAALHKTDSALAETYLPRLQQDARENLKEEILTIYYKRPTPERLNYLFDEYVKSDLGMQLHLLDLLIDYVQKEDAREDIARKAVDGIYVFYTSLPSHYNRWKEPIHMLLEKNKRGSEETSLKGNILTYFREKFGL